MEVNGILNPCKRNNIIGGQLYGNAGCHLRGFCTPNCWGWPNEVGSSTTIFRKKATRGSSLAYLDGEIYEIDVLRPHRLVGCSAMRVEGAVSSWINVLLQDGAEGRLLVFHTWAQFKHAMVKRFEAVTEVEEA